jgi:stress response protein YsnF
MKSSRETRRKPSSPPTVPMAEETAWIRKRQVVKGKVRVRTITETSDEMIETTVQDRSVEVVRVPVDRVVREAPIVRTEDGVTIVPILEEIVIVQTQLVLKEELRIRQMTESRKEKVPIRLRKQRAVVERIPGERVADEE